MQWFSKDLTEKSVGQKITKWEIELAPFWGMALATFKASTIPGKMAFVP